MSMARTGLLLALLVFGTASAETLSIIEDDDDGVYVFDVFLFHHENGSYAQFWGGSLNQEDSTTPWDETTVEIAGPGVYYLSVWSLQGYNPVLTFSTSDGEATANSNSSMSENCYHGDIATYKIIYDDDGSLTVTCKLCPFGYTEYLPKASWGDVGVDDFGFAGISNVSSVMWSEGLDYYYIGDFACLAPGVYYIQHNRSADESIFALDGVDVETQIVDSESEYQQYYLILDYNGTVSYTADELEVNATFFAMPDNCDEHEVNFFFHLNQMVKYPDEHMFKLIKDGDDYDELVALGGQFGAMSSVCLGAGDYSFEYRELYPDCICPMSEFGTARFDVYYGGVQETWEFFENSESGSRTWSDYTSTYIVPGSLRMSLDFTVPDCDDGQMLIKENVTCRDFSCPDGSDGTDLSTGCVCNAGYSGTISATSSAPYFTGSCAAVSCPDNSDGTDVPTGCVCNATGYSGGPISASSSAPYFNGSCTAVACDVGSSGTAPDCGACDEEGYTGTSSWDADAGAWSACDEAQYTSGAVAVTRSGVVVLVGSLLLALL